jgi:DNA invertase Pin-like site-specific DNA recombinase
MNENFLDFDSLYNDYYLKSNEYYTKCACYIRVSTDDQVEYSPTSQLKLLLKYALDNDLFIDKKYIFHDDGISGTNSKNRNSFLKMIAVAKSKPKPFEKILVYDFSRFARNKEESVMYKTLLRKKLKIDVISITQPLTEGKERVILESMYEAMDEYYSLNLSENVQRGKREKAERGEHNGFAPFGYKLVNKQLVIDEENAKLVKMIYNMFINTENIKHICNTLNDLGIKSTRGKLWGRKTLKLILTNKTYIGYVKNGNNYYKGLHEPIIDNETFDKVQKIWEYRDEHFYKCRKQVQHNHWLRGILKCGNCGYGMYYFKRKDRNYAIFQCGGYLHGKCDSHYLRVDNTEQLIIEQLKNDYTEKVDINISKSDTNTEYEIALSNLKSLENKLNRVKESYINGIDTLEEYKDNKKKIQQQIENVNNKIEQLKEPSKEAVYKKCEQAYKLLSDKKVENELKSEISHALFEKIVYYKDSKILAITYK